MTYYRTKTNLITLALAVAVLISAGAVSRTVAQRYVVRPKATAFTQQGTNAAANATFSSARDLIDDAQWAKAEAQFGQYIAKYPNEQNLDAAMYWLAYSQYKLRKFNQSKDTLDRLLKTYEKTSWREEAELLRAQLPGAVVVKVDPVVTVDPAGPVVVVDPVVVTPKAIAIAGQDPVEVNIRSAEMQEKIAAAQARAAERTREAQERMQERIAAAKDKFKDKDFKFDFDFDFDFDSDDDKKSSDDPCEFKLVVLQALIESDPQRGIAVATDWVKPNSGQTPTCKRTALKLLARHGGKAAVPTILGVAQNEADLKVRTTAISLLGSSNEESVIDPLRDFALNSQQQELTDAAMYALSQHTSPRAIAILTDIALSTKPVTSRKTAIAYISSRPGEPAVDALFKIYDSSQDLEIRKAVISGFSRRKSPRAGDRLVQIAQGNDNLELRKAAISSIGRRGGEQAITTLLPLYDSVNTPELQDQIMNALGYSNDPRVTDKLISIAKNPQTPIDRKRRAILLLSSRSKDPKVIAFLEDLLKQ
jgi:HEAT repeat protein